MEKSIEIIWKEGFLKGNALVAPKVNDLYNQKSKNLIDRFIRKFRLNQGMVVAMALLVLTGSILVGLPFVGIGLFLMFAVLVLIGKRLQDDLARIDKGSNSYAYLKSFDGWLKKGLAVYRRFYRFFYPLFYLLMLIGMWQMADRQAYFHDMFQDPGLYPLWGIPMLLAIPLILLAIPIGLLSGRLYKFDLQVVYGPEFRKLEEMIADMEDLRG